VKDIVTSATPQRTGVSPTQREIRNSLANAANRTGVDFDFLLAKARVESGLRPGAAARSSSAAGLFQFTQSTWLSVIRDHGAKHGLAREAAAVMTDRSGAVDVADPALKREILALRKDPKVSALMAAEYARQNERYLETRLGREAGPADLYAAHLFGPAGAVRFLKALDADPAASAASLLPGAARANKSIFYAGGRARTVAEIQDWLAGRLDLGRPPGLALADDGGATAA